MSNMQAFYNSLVSHQASEQPDPHRHRLARLMSATRSQIAALRSRMGWEEWGASATN
jgi:hypothetical protein